MCRVFSYLSVNPILLDDVLRRPINAVTKQIEAEWLGEPFYNVDGYGFTWYSETRAKYNPLIDAETDALTSIVKPSAAGIHSGEARIKDGPLLPFVVGPQPAIYKTIAAQPLNDPCFVSICANVESRCILAHMRAAPYPPIATTNCHPFVFGRHSFMYNGGIYKFDEVRKDILNQISPGFVWMIDGNVSAEHLGALYMTYLCDPDYSDFRGAAKHYTAREMWTALKKAIQKVEEIQKNHGMDKPDNYFNTCAADGESMIGLCYRTYPPPVPLWLSVDAADILNRKSCYRSHKTIDCPVGNIHKAGRALRENAKSVLTRGPNNEVTGIEPEILYEIEGEENTLSQHGPHVIVASEPTTIIQGEESPHWYKLSNKEVVLVDTVWKGDIRTIALNGDSFD